MQRGGSRLLFVAAVEDDLRAMERMSGIKAERHADWSEVSKGRSREAALLADFDAGFIGTGRKPLVVVTASDVLGSRAHHPQPMARSWNPAFDHPDVPEKGAAIVHLQRGLAVLDGLQTLDMGRGSRREMVRLAFAGDNAVLVPPSDLAVIWPYAGEPGKLTLDKADGSSWWARRTEAEAEIQVAAKALAKHISQRRRRRAPKLVPPGANYEKFVARFPYFTTVDQAKAIQDVLDDLASGHPMDRVICGDVGFGKTEVALRAAAAVALSGKQVAIAAPTTVLARQHVETFRKRFGPLGIEVGSLSRASSGPETRETKEGLRRGRLKVVVGTQALAAKDVKFADLGLVIIDEEQHFGAAEKTKLSGLAKGAHSLWMSATPIPRTLAAGLAGFRDLSVIASPPVHRLPIVTRIAPLSEAAIAAALLRERRRNGQSFLICPRIQDLEPVLARVQSVAPELRIVCLHGRLPVEEIDDRMMSFVDGEADVLLATNIVESGLDIPPRQHHRGVLARKVRPGTTASAQGAGGTRRHARVCPSANGIDFATVREASGGAGGVQQAGCRLCDQRARPRPQGRRRSVLGTAVRARPGVRTRALQSPSEARLRARQRHRRRSVGPRSQYAAGRHAA
ncbi:transcription-repair coupling factor (superfamily II helicase) [Bradyrhizobium sp. LB9.1b]